MKLSSKQIEIIEAHSDMSVFLHGPAGSGKTTAGIERLNYLVENGVEGREILLLFPQRNLGARYQKYIKQPSFPGSSLPVTATYSGLAKRLISLFWPTIVQIIPEFSSNKQPTFLTLESSLYFLARIVDPLISEEGFFSTVTIQRNRLYSQILDNLNKSAIHAFPHTEIAQRLISAWIGDPTQELIYEQAQVAANNFRKYCYQENLLDFSLQIELFNNMVADLPLLLSHLQNQFNHLVYDNIEEDIPIAHDLVKKLLPELSSSLIIYDEDAGYRSFLGASPESGYQLSSLCDTVVHISQSFTSSSAFDDFNSRLNRAIENRPLVSSKPDRDDLFSIHYQPYYPQMASWIASEIRQLLDNDVKPDQIVVLAPFLSDSLRFILARELESQQIPYASHRPSRALRDEPVTQCLLTLSALAHPDWEVHPSAYELARAFIQAFKGLDLTRAYLLSRAVLRTKSKISQPGNLANFEDLDPDLQNRITYIIGSQYQQTCDWLSSYMEQSPLALDHYLSRLFGELLTRPDFGFHNDLTKGRITSQIIDSFNKFRKTAGDVLQLAPQESGHEYYRMVKFGVLANQYLRDWTEVPTDKVFLAPAYTFLLNNRPTEYQFWLDIGSRGWYERIYQPLTNPHVLHRSWPVGKKWTDAEETDLNAITLKCLATGLIRRCRKKVFGCLTETDERGYEQTGMLIQSLNRVILQNHALSQIREVRDE
jgi:superfamily I DNA/RNA helicase